jgi:hypothetical protein
VSVTFFKYSGQLKRVKINEFYGLDDVTDTISQARITPIRGLLTFFKYSGQLRELISVSDSIR